MAWALPQNEGVSVSKMDNITADNKERICTQHYPRKVRIAFYSHDTMGLGHVRRNLLIAQTLSTCDLKPETLLISGAWETSSFLMPAGIDFLILPAVCKEQDGKYRSRRLDISFPELISLRSQIIHCAVSGFKPDVLIVDNVPRGVAYELDRTLEYARSQKGIRCVLGLRDVLDEVSVVHNEWSHHHNYETITKYFDQIWIYGDPAIYDAAKEYSYPPEIVSKIRYTGYLDQSLRLHFVGSRNTGLPCPDIGVPGNPYVLCMVGGGQDGFQLAQAFVNADLPKGTKGVLVSGPHMEPELREKLWQGVARKSHESFRLYEFVSEPTVLLQHADCVISMGGYNTVSEILSFGKPTLIVPRTSPRKEQLIRADRLKEMGIVDVLYPEALSADELTRWIRDNSVRPARDFRQCVDLNGLSRIPAFLFELLKEEG